jgi:hypothetical protein
MVREKELSSGIGARFAISPLHQRGLEFNSVNTI